MDIGDQLGPALGGDPVAAEVPGERVGVDRDVEPVVGAADPLVPDTAGVRPDMGLAPPSRAGGTLVGVEDCPRRKRGGCGGTPRGVSLKGAGRIAFPEAALEELARQGWRRRWPSPWASSHIQSPYLRVLAPEMPAIYRRALFGRFFPRWLALQTFLGNLHAANRILAPAPHGYQFGHRAVEQRVAKLAVRLSRRARKG